MKTSEILRRAKGLVPEAGGFVCHAIRRAVPIWYSEDARRAERVLERIEKALHPHEVVSHWLHAKHKVPYSAMTDDALIDYRQRWLDALIAEYEAKGD